MGSAFWIGLAVAADAAASSDDFGLNTWPPRFWLIGNAKARRRWRRRDVPNSQRSAAMERERSIIARALSGDA